MSLTDKPWMNANLKILIKKRQKAFISGDKFLCKMLRNKVNRERKRCRKEYYNLKVRDLQHVKPRDWWREVKKFCGIMKGPQRNIRSILRTHTNFNDLDLANEINNAFVSIMEDYEPLSEDLCVQIEQDEPIVVDEISVARKLRHINITKSSGPDDIPNWLLKEYSDILSPAITHILNASFGESKVPRAWKLANVSPLPKSNTIEDFNKDLRPISLTSTLSKIAESFIIEQDVKPTLLNVIDPQQFGFIPDSSTTLAIISMLHEWLEATDGTGSCVRIALLDYRKAFDLVDHKLLIAKLFSLGIKPTTVNWLIDFLRDRSQRVKINSDCFSNFRTTPAGIPQGTKIGPWLFLAMINDLSVSGASSKLWKFADDSTVSEVISKSDVSNLQKEIDIISSWTKENRFQINPIKCKELRVDFSKQQRTDDAIIVDGQTLEVVKSAKILGVTVRNDLKWYEHVDIITKKASKRLYLLKLLRRAGVELDALVKFYCACVRSVLEYACQAFHSSLPVYLTKQIERIQKRALRIICPAESYEEALSITKLGTLFDRREHLSLELFQKISNNNQHKLFNLLPELSTNELNLRCKAMYKIPSVKTNRFRDSFVMHYASQIKISQF